MRRYEISPFKAVNPFSLFEDFEKSFWPAMKNGEARDFFPRLDIGEKEGIFYASVDVPGMKKEDIHIDVNGSVVSISGERKEERKAEHYSEKVYGSFQRSFKVPAHYDLEKIEAHYEDGVLNLAMPLKEQVENKSKKVEIKSEKDGIFNKLF